MNTVNPYLPVLQRTMADEYHTRLHGVGLVDDHYVVSNGFVIVRVPIAYFKEDEMTLPRADNFPDISKVYPGTDIVWEGEIPLEYIKACRVKYQLIWVFSGGGCYVWDATNLMYVKVHEMPIVPLTHEHAVGLNLHLLKNVISRKTRHVFVKIPATKRTFSKWRQVEEYVLSAATFTADDGLDGLIMPITLKDFHATVTTQSVENKANTVGT